MRNTPPFPPACRPRRARTRPNSLPETPSRAKAHRRPKTVESQSFPRRWGRCEEPRQTSAVFVPGSLRARAPGWMQLSPSLRPRTTFVSRSAAIACNAAPSREDRVTVPRPKPGLLKAMFWGSCAHGDSSQFIVQTHQYITPPTLSVSAFIYRLPLRGMDGKLVRKQG
jgi:hypothetical protein